MGLGRTISFEVLSSFSSISNPQGFSTITDNICDYLVVDKVMFVFLRISGLSSATTKTITLPYISVNKGVNIHQVISAQIVNNVTVSTTPGKISVADNSYTCSFFRDGNNLAWTAANSSCTIVAQFMVQLG